MLNLSSKYNIYKNTVDELIKSGISKNEASIEAEMLIEYVFNIKKIDIITNPHVIVDNEKAEKLKILIKKRIEERIPVQYLTNKAYFMGYEFYVNENVLIPRPETEILVEEVLKKAENLDKESTIIDVGTGSGCIACMLAKNLDVKVTASDISQEALKIAKKNADELDVKEKIEFVHSDILNNIYQQADIIVSNPPYIPIKEKENLDFEVAGNEPHLALFAEDEKGISFYEKLILQSIEKLRPNGYLAFETGINQADFIKELLEKSNFKNIEIIKDYSGIERILISKKK